eukprot:m.53572 g.53572  ORF g.53572 m.53572 type:complete len:98 (-) comp15451_c0_seq2:674-967(-)
MEHSQPEASHAGAHLLLLRVCHHRCRSWRTSAATLIPTIVKPAQTSAHLQSCCRTRAENDARWKCGMFRHEVIFTAVHDLCPVVSVAKQRGVFIAGE